MQEVPEGDQSVKQEVRTKIFEEADKVHVQEVRLWKQKHRHNLK